MNKTEKKEKNCLGTFYDDEEYIKILGGNAGADTVSGTGTCAGSGSSEWPVSTTLVCICGGSEGAGAGEVFPTLVCITGLTNLVQVPQSWNPGGWLHFR